MSTCNQFVDPTPLTIVDDIKTLINDNYNMLIVYTVLVICLLCILIFICNDIYNIIKNYLRFKNLQAVKEKSKSLLDTSTNNPKDPAGDDETYPIYDEDNPYVAIGKKPKDYKPENEKAFFRNIDNKYKEYNTQKREYIKHKYSRNDDDIINDTLLYPKYDDYDYRDPKKEY